MTAPHLLIWVGLAIMAIAVVALVALAVASSRARAQGPEHPGVQLDSPPLRPLPPAPVVSHRRPSPRPRPLPPSWPQGRHHEDTVVIVPPDWRPPTAADRIRALEETHILRPPAKEDRP